MPTRTAMTRPSGNVASCASGAPRSDMVVPFCRSGPGGKRGNGVGVNRARALRLAVAVAVLAATGLLSAPALATSRSERSLPTLNRQVLAAVNGFRAAHGLVRLRESSALDRSARQHSPEMGRLG